ncbi:MULTISPECIES: hypothetical protein [unclassified Sphingomonas]|jgi:hypothetical protein|uniref:hypothetical protein n=1 Tax=unclassified Sphingomonas TaxID=196159 RepID=UPI000A6794DA|nr:MULTISPECIES: hypothetical protein [unclassified Sphingomonas]
MTRAPRPPAGISAAIDAAIARDPRLRATLAGLNAGQRDHVHRAIAHAVKARLRDRGGPQ